MVCVVFAVAVHRGLSILEGCGHAVRARSDLSGEVLIGAVLLAVHGVVSCVKSLEPEEDVLVFVEASVHELPVDVRGCMGVDESRMHLLCNADSAVSNGAATAV